MALGGLLLNDPPDPFEIPIFAEIRTPEETVDVEYVQTWAEFNEVGYFSSGNQPVQTGIVEWLVTSGQVAGGHSGSPVIDENYQLLGMHIAGPDSGDKAFMIKADDLFFGLSFGHPGEIELHNKF